MGSSFIASSNGSWPTSSAVWPTCSAMQVELIEALNDTNALHGLFIDATARRLSSIAEEAEGVGT